VLQLVDLLEYVWNACRAIVGASVGCCVGESVGGLVGCFVGLSVG
jgi:hypothetical protein